MEIRIFANCIMFRLSFLLQALNSIYGRDDSTSLLTTARQVRAKHQSEDDVVNQATRLVEELHPKNKVQFLKCGEYKHQFCKWGGIPPKKLDVKTAYECKEKCAAETTAGCCESLNSCVCKLFQAGVLPNGNSVGTTRSTMCEMD